MENPLVTHLAVFFFGMLISWLIGRQLAYDEDDDFDKIVHKSDENEDVISKRDDFF